MSVKKVHPKPEPILYPTFKSYFEPPDVLTLTLL